MLKALCTKFCQVRKPYGIVNCHAGNVYTFDDTDSYPRNCFRVLEKTEEAPADNPAPVKTVKKTVKRKKRA